MNQVRRITILISTAILLFYVQGCAVNVRPAKITAEPFIPPAPVIEASQPTNNPVDAPSQASSPADCSNNLTYLQDLTIPDGTQVEAGASIDKRWEVQNSGSCSWDSGYTLRLVAGSNLGAPDQQPLYPARPGAKAVIQVTFTAPSDSDTYSSSWQAFDPQGQAFGDLIFIEIVVP